MVSVNIASSGAAPSFMDRVLHNTDRTVVRESSTTTISTEPAARFSWKNALTFGGIGASIAGALGGVSLLGKVALPVIGRIASLGGIAKLAGIGGVVGIGVAALPIVAPAIQDSPVMKAALTGASIGAAASFILPGGPIFGAVVGAGIGLAVHVMRGRRNVDPGYATYPGYAAYPGFAPYGTSPGAPVPNGFVAVTPSFGGYGGYDMQQRRPGLLGRMFGMGGAQLQQPAWGASMVGAGYPSAGYPGAGYPGYAPAGAGYSPYGTLGMAPSAQSAQAIAQGRATAQAQLQAQAHPAPAATAPRPGATSQAAGPAGRSRKARTWKTSRQQQAAAAERAARAHSSASTRDQAALAQQQAMAQAQAQPQGVAGYMPQGMFAGGTPFSAGQAGLQQLMAQAPSAMSPMGPAAGTSGAPQLTGLSAATAGAALPPMPTA